MPYTFCIDMVNHLTMLNFTLAPICLNRTYEHPKGSIVVISGNLGDDTKPYQEKQVKLKIEESQR